MLRVCQDIGKVVQQPPEAAGSQHIGQEQGGRGGAPRRQPQQTGGREDAARTVSGGAEPPPKGPDPHSGGIEKIGPGQIWTAQHRPRQEQPGQRPSPPVRSGQQEAGQEQEIHAHGVVAQGHNVVRGEEEPGQGGGPGGRAVFPDAMVEIQGRQPVEEHVSVPGRQQYAVGGAGGRLVQPYQGGGEQSRHLGHMPLVHKQPVPHAQPVGDGEVEGVVVGAEAEGAFPQGEQDGGGEEQGKGHIPPPLEINCAGQGRGHLLPAGTP